MVDTVSYKLPFGIMGLVAHAVKVRRDLESVFDYRHQQIAEKFGAACR
jgi:ligand-binding SRPBCC domain-containing protein